MFKVREDSRNVAIVLAHVLRTRDKKMLSDRRARWMATSLWVASRPLATWPRCPNLIRQFRFAHNLLETRFLENTVVDRNIDAHLVQASDLLHAFCTVGDLKCHLHPVDFAVVEIRPSLARESALAKVFSN